jgi:uncharacterized protein YjbI with pentapeptide repeats
MKEYAMTTGTAPRHPLAPSIRVFSTGADLRGAVFTDCDLREADLHQTLLDDARFEGSWVGGATGLTVEQVQLVSSRGGIFLMWGDCPTSRLAALT